MALTQDIKTLMTKAATLGHQGALDEAALLYLRAADLAGNDIWALLDSAKGLEGVKRYGKAHDVYIKALKLEPKNYIIHARLGALYVAIEQIAAALKHYKIALELNPNDPDLLFNYALAKQTDDDLEGALKILDQCLEKGGDRRLVLGTKAEIYEQTNQLDKLQEILGEALETFPTDGYLNFFAAKAERRRGNPEKALFYLDRIPDGDELNDIETVLNFERGRIFDLLDDTEKAFQGFTRGNELCLRENMRANASKEFSLDQIRRYSAVSYTNWKKVTAPEIKEDYLAPAFLIGFPRSGTTLLHQILDGHPGLEVLEERPLIPVIKHHILQQTKNYPNDLDKIDPRVLTAIQTDYIKASQQFRAKGPATKIVDKLPLNLIDVPLIVKIFPNAKFIVALRHPCDCTLSCFMQNFGINNAMLNFTNLDDATTYYDQVFGLWRKYKAELDLDHHYVRYEDIITDLEGEAKKVIRFLGLEWDERVLDYRKQAKAKKRIATPSYHQVVKPIYKDAKDRWKRYQKYLDPYLDRLKPYIEEFGYEL